MARQTRGLGVQRGASVAHRGTRTWRPSISRPTMPSAGNARPAGPPPCTDAPHRPPGCRASRRSRSRPDRPAQQRQHRLLHPRRQSRRGASRRQHVIRTRTLRPAAWPPCGRPAPRHAPAPAGPARGRARRARPATPDWRAGTPRRTRGRLIYGRAPGWVPLPSGRLISEVRRSAGPSSPSRPGTRPGPCRSAGG